MDLAETFLLEQKARLLRQYSCASLQEVTIKLEAAIKHKKLAPPMSET